MLSKVGLPQPLGPISATSSRAAPASSTSLMASTKSSPWAKVFETFWISIMAAGASLHDGALVAAIHVDVGAADEAGALGGQERHRIGNILWHSPATQGHV